MPTTPKTPNPHHEDKFVDWQERTPQPGDKTLYMNMMLLTPKTIGSSIIPRMRPGTMTLRTLGGRLGKALSEASTAPTSAEGLMRQRMSRKIVNSVPVPSKSKAIVLGHNGQDPIRINALWYLNVHAPPPFEWLRTQAVLYRNVLILTRIAPTGGRGVVTLDLIALRSESAELVETLCPFQLLYTDGVERLGTDTARERVCWVGAIWEVSATIACMPASPSESSLQRPSSVQSLSSEGSASTHFVPPFDNIPDMASTLSHQSLFAMPRQTADDMSVASLVPVPPARAPSLRRTASMADMKLEADIDRALNRSSARGAPVTVTSGASQGESTLMSPPPGRRRSGAYTPTETSGPYTPSASATDRSRSSFYASSNVTGHDDTYVPTDAEQSILHSLQIEADTLSFRGSCSASMLGDSRDAFSTGYGSGRGESRNSMAAYSRLRTLSPCQRLPTILLILLFPPTYAILARKFFSAAHLTPTPHIISSSLRHIHQVSHQQLLKATTHSWLCIYMPSVDVFLQQSNTPIPHQYLFAKLRQADKGC
ncbi:proteophosphoglycan 5 [Ceratobasidium sp. AG-Ba]|nr:proteophosphoglycan 5 [Ceratobasidium sp. AG-Ba]